MQKKVLVKWKQKEWNLEANIEAEENQNQNLSKIIKDLTEENSILKKRKLTDFPSGNRS